MARNRNHHLRKIGDVWYFETMVKGKRVKKALDTSLAEARRKRDEHLKEIELCGGIRQDSPKEDQGVLFGEFVKTWAEIKAKQVKGSTMRDYRSTMNLHVLPRFGNTPIREISYLDVEKFKTELTCSAKRVNNILVPMRSVFRMALKSKLIDENVMPMVDNLRVDPPTINPLTPAEVKKVLGCVHPHYREFFVTAFFTGMRFGEMAALKKGNVDLERGTLRVRETLVYGVEGRPKTVKSNRDIDLLAPVAEALKAQMAKTGKKVKHVFLDLSGNPLTPDHVRNVVWERALKKAGISHRPMIQTRHTFATLMIDAGEEIGWVQKMLGHSSLQMIWTHYYSWVKKATRNDGAAFMQKSYGEIAGEEKTPPGAQEEVPSNFTPDLHQEMKRTYTESM